MNHNKMLYLDVLLKEDRAQMFEVLMGLSGKYKRVTIQAPLA